MKNKDILSWKLKEILERQPVLGRFLEDMCLKIYHFKNSDMIIDACSVKEFLEELMKDFEILGIEEDKTRKNI